MNAVLIALALVASGDGPEPTMATQRATLVAGIRTDLEKAMRGADAAEREHVLAVIAALQRENFVPKRARPYAYLRLPLNIGFGQTISDAYVVTLMTIAVHVPAGANVLDVGTGSGYQAAVLSPLARFVSSIEIVKRLAGRAAHRLRTMGYRNISIKAGDGFLGDPRHAPFDAIIVAAGAAEIPQPLLDQLKPGGRLVMPIGPSTFQEQLVVAAKAMDGTVSRCSLGPASFVPLTGRGERSADLRGLYDRTIPPCYGSFIT